MEIFLSTPSARRATCPHPRCQAAADDFYPRPPRGGRPSKGGRAPILQTISIHALREEGNQHGAAVGVKYYVFLSTPSARRATRRPSLPPGRLSDFYPRPPRGGRHDYLRTNVGLQLFLSTPSARRATPVIPGSPPGLSISIHALREEGDAAIAARRPLSNDFYPRPPRGGRRGGRRGNPLPESISIHALREEGDCFPAVRPRLAYNFYPRPPRGGRPACSL